MFDRNLSNCVPSSSVPGQPGKFKIGKVTDTSIELSWEPAYTKEKIVNYELLYKPVKFGGLVSLSFDDSVCCSKLVRHIKRDKRCLKD